MPWLLGLGLALVAAALVLRRHQRLAAETRRLARHQRVLRSVNRRLQHESRTLREQAINDPLTGVLNRQAFAAELRDMLERAARYGHPVTLIVLDLDHFKAINDRLGHLTGDSALKLVTGIVHEQLVSADLFGRFGGDEFLIACPDRTPDAVEQLAEHLRRAVERAATGHQPPLPGLTLSMGLAQATSDTGYAADALFARADAALYEAKRAGRNRAVTAATAGIRDDAPAPLHRHL